MIHRFSSLVVLSLGVMGLLSCSGDEAVLGGGTSVTESGKPIVVVDSTKMILQSTAGELSQGTYRFQVVGTAPAMDSGSVLVGPQNGGYLRLVRSVTQSGSTLRVETDPAALTDAVENGRLHISTITEPGGTLGRQAGGIRWGALSARALVPGVTIENGRIDLANVVLFGDSSNGLSITDGSLSFAPTATLDVSIGFWKITSLQASVGGSMNLDANIRLGLTGAFSAVPDSIPFEVIEQPFEGVIAGFPVYGRLVTTFSFVPLLMAQGQVTMQTGLSATAGVTIGAKYENGQWQSLTGPQFTDSIKPLTVTIGGKVVAQLGLRVQSQMILYETVAPYLWVKPYFEAEASVDLLRDTWNTSCTSAVNAGVGISVKILSHVLADFNTDEDFFKKTWDSCNKSGALTALGSLTTLTGNNQSAAVGSALPAPLTVQVLGLAGLPVAGVPVTFATGDGGSLQPSVAVTDLLGRAQSAWTLGSSPGSQTATASAANYSGSPGTFSALATNTAGCPPVPYTLGNTGTGVITASDCRYFNTQQSFDNYLLNVATPQALLLEMSASFDPYFSVNIDPGGAVNTGFSAPSGSAMVTEKVIAPEGTLYVRPAALVVGATGSYSFSVTNTSSDVTKCENVVLVSGANTTQQLSVTDCTESGRYADQYHIALGVGWTARVIMRSTSFDAFLSLFDDSGSLQATDDDGAGGSDAQLVFTNTTNDILGYTIHATSTAARATGGYTLTFTVTPRSSLVASGAVALAATVQVPVGRRPSTP